jgi:hypothetical protein
MTVVITLVELVITLRRSPTSGYYIGLGLRDWLLHCPKWFLHCFGVGGGRRWTAPVVGTLLKVVITLLWTGYYFVVIGYYIPFSGYYIGKSGFYIELGFMKYLCIVLFFL